MFARIRVIGLLVMPLWVLVPPVVYKIANGLL